MNYYIGNISFDANYLEHHGILGMKWGQRNGPPYPLDAKDHSASEKKAGWRKSLEGKVAEIKKKSSKAITKASLKANKKVSSTSVGKAIEKGIQNSVRNSLERGRIINKHPVRNAVKNLWRYHKITTTSKVVWVGTALVTTLLSKNPTTGVHVANIAYGSMVASNTYKIGRDVTSSLFAGIVDKSIERYEANKAAANSKKK